MRTKTRVVALVGLLAVWAAGAAAQQGKGQAPVYKTPEAAFDAWVAAMKKGDYRAMADCMSPEMHKRAAGQLAVGAMAIRAASAGDDEAAKKFREKYKPFFAVLDRHGLTPEATKEIKIDNTPAGRAKSALEVAALIKDPKAVMLALQAAYEKAGLIKPTASADLDLKLKDVKVSGDKASGVMTGKAAGKDAKVPQHFVKVGGGWVLTLPPEKGAGKAG